MPNKSVKRISIEGRAGVGKTALVQYIAYQWATTGLFNEEYDYLLWVPLREWLHNESSVSNNFTENLAAFLHTRYFEAETNTARLEELKAVLSSSNENNIRTLLVLDGFDEVAHHLSSEGSASMHGRLLRQALRFPQVIVTTRDYQLPPITFDNTLVNIGFTDAQVEHYIAHYPSWVNISSMPNGEGASPPAELKSASAVTFTKTLRSNPRLWALAHVPLNLALICKTLWPTSSDNSTKLSDTALANLTLSVLYEKVLENFLLRQLQKEVMSAKQREEYRFYTTNMLKREFIIEWDSLCTLAWEGFKKGKVILSTETQKNLIPILKKRYPNQEDYLTGFLARAFNMGLLRSLDQENSNPLDQRRYFIHLTFQEYLAAQYIVDTLQGYRGKPLYLEILEWIKQHKYDPHTAVMMGFIAGISAQSEYEQARKAFWHALLSTPHDITGLSHLRLMLRCLEEARYNKKNIPHYEKLIEEIKQWGKLLLTPKLCNTEVSDGFWDLLRQYPQACKQSKLINILLTAAGNQNHKKYTVRWMADVAKNVLSEISQKPKPAHQLKAPVIVSKNATDQNEGVDAQQMKIQACKNIVVELAYQPETLVAVLKAAGDQNEDVRQAAKESLSKIDGELARQLKALAVVLKAAGDWNKDVSQAAGEVLNKVCGGLAHQSQALKIVLTAAGGQNWNVRQAARKVLGNMVKHQPESLTTLLEATTHKNWAIRQAAIEAFGQLGVKLAQQHIALQAVVKAINDEDYDVRKAAVQAIGNMGTKLVLQQPALAPLLLNTADDKDYHVREAVIKVFNQLGTELAQQRTILKIVLKAVDDKDYNVRKTAVQALGNMGTNYEIQQNTLTTVLKAVGDKDEHVRQVAVTALGNIMGRRLVQHPVALVALLKAVEDKDENVRQAAKEELGKLRNPKNLTTILKAVNNKDCEYPGVMIEVLTTALEIDAEDLVREPGALVAVLRVAYDQSQNRDICKAARKLQKAHGAIYIQGAIRYYLSTEKSSNGILKSWNENPWLSNIVHVTSLKSILFSTGLILGKKKIQILLSNNNEVVTLPSSATIKPLIESITQEYAKYGLTLPDYAHCIEEESIWGTKKLFYPEAKQPEFKELAWPEPRALPSTSSSVICRELTQERKSTADNNRELKERLKPPYSLKVPTPDITTSMPTTSDNQKVNEESKSLSSTITQGDWQTSSCPEYLYNYKHGIEKDLQRLEANLKQKPKDIFSLTNYGHALLSLNRTQEALASYEAALAIDPTFPSPLEGRELCLKQLGGGIVPHQPELLSDVKENKIITTPITVSNFSNFPLITTPACTLTECSLTPTSTTLDVDRSQITDEGLANLAEMLSKNTRLTKLNLPEDRKRSQPSAQSHARIHAYLYRNRLLAAHQVTAQQLHDYLDFSVLTGEDVRSLLLRHTTVDTWDFSDKQLDAKAVILQLAYLPHYPSLRRLNLNNNRLGDAGAEQIGVLLSDPHLLPNLVVLTLANNRIQALGFSYLADAMKRNVKLKELDLSQNFIQLSDVTLKKRAEEFAENPHLRRIMLSGNALLPSADMLLVNDKGVEESKAQSNQKNSDISSSRGPIAFFRSQPPRMKSIIDPSKEIDRGQWVVALGCKKDDQHAVLYLEGMRESGQRFITHYHIVAPAVISDEAQVKIKNLDIGRLANSHHRHYFRPFTIDRVKGESLREHIENQHASKEEIPFSTFYNSSTGRVNCTGWCRAELILIGLDVPSTDIPSVAAGGPYPGSRCLVM